MKILIKNLGPIHEFEFDLDKDLHLVYGKNSIGKSHAIAAVYLILKKLKPIFFSKVLLDSDIVTTNISNSLFIAFRNTFNETSFKNVKIEVKAKTFELTVQSNGSKGFEVTNLGFTTDNSSFRPSFIANSEIAAMPKLYFLPASRSGLYSGVNSIASIFAELSQLRYAMPNASIKLPTYSEPVSDYFLTLTSATIPNSDSDIFNDMGKKIENEVLNGSISVNPESKKIEFHDTKHNIRMDVTQTSSMVSELAPLVTFLKYILKDERDEEGNQNSYCLFIEEPEAHLHPSVQIELMKIFAEMANSGIKVIMTTHSDFMFNELTNLILGDKIKSEQVASIHLVMTEKGSVDKGDMRATADGMDDYNFAEVSEQLYEERMRLIDLKNETTDAIH